MSLRDLVLVAGVLVSSALGCSFIRDLSVDQCSTDGDCARFGDYECSAQKVCVARDTAGAGAGNAGSAGNGGSSGSSSTSGSAGEGAAAECTKNADCIEAHDGEPYICRDEACVPLTIPEHCPEVIAGTEENPTEYLTKPGKPIIFGAYVPIDVTDPIGHPYTINYRFALEEFMQGSLGGIGTPPRPFVMVLCQSTKPDLEASAAHLVETLQVPGILAALPSNDLNALRGYAVQSERKVFLLGPLEADSALTQADDQGLMWHMLGPATDLVPTYVPLVKLAETYLRDQLGRVAANLNVALIHSDLTYSVDMADELQTKAIFNGRALSAKENKAFYKRYQVKVTGGDGPQTAGVIADLNPVNGSFQPDLVIALGGAEFVNPILPGIQEGRSANTTPFYIFSPRNAYDKQLTGGKYFDQAPDWKEFFRAASAGVNYASVEDSTLYDNYLLKIQSKYDVEGLESRENFYDAAYFMLYSLAAASLTSSNFDGDDVVTGMKALIEGDEVNIGPDKIATVFNFLREGGKVSLRGTMGPPDFNPITGARRSQGSVWCLKVPSGSVEFDVARLNPADPERLEATREFCYDGFIDPPAAK